MRILGRKHRNRGVSMEIYMLEYYEEVEYKDFNSEKYNLIGLYFSEAEAQRAKERIALEMNISKEFLFVSATKVGKLQWEGGFVTV